MEKFLKYSYMLSFILMVVGFIMCGIFLYTGKYIEYVITLSLSLGFYNMTDLQLYKNRENGNKR